jgi:hypothetical protein
MSSSSTPCFRADEWISSGELYYEILQAQPAEPNRAIRSPRGEATEPRRKEILSHISDPGVTDPQAVEQCQDFTQVRPISDGHGCRPVQRFNGLAPRLPVGIRPYRRGLVAGRADRLVHRRCRPCRRNPPRESPQSGGCQKTKRVDGELFEVRKVHSAARGRIEARILRSQERPLDNRVRNTETLGERPVAPISVVGKQPAEDVNIGILDHGKVAYQVSIHDTPSERDRPSAP